MIIKIMPSSLQGAVHVIASKSLSHRYLIAAALSEKPSHIKNTMVSLDIEATCDALKKLGAKINHETIQGGYPQVTDFVINAKESGSTLRFVIPLAMLQNKPIMFKGEGRLAHRSLDGYESLFKAKGFQYNRLSKSHLPIKVSGPLQPGAYRIKGDVSSQFISGLLFALPLLSGDSEIIIDPPFESKSYVELTLNVLKEFQIVIERTKNGFHIPGNQIYHAIDASIEGDYSQAAFFIVAALINDKPLTLYNLNLSSIQGDREILTIIKRMKGSYTFNDDLLIVFPSKTVGTTIDLADIPDLGPILMVLAAVSEGTTVFNNIRRLRYKESDRIHAMESVLTQFGVTYTVDDNHMTIKGQKTLKGNQHFDSFNDHRIAMSLIVASLKTDGPLYISNIEAINKSYPTFLDVFTALNGTITRDLEVIK